MKKVILIGGSPYIGKSTASITLASKLQYPCISTDDIGSILQTVTDINPMKGKNYLDYYADSEKEQLIDDIVEYHKWHEKAIHTLIDVHSTWSTPLVMEGWALYPSKHAMISNDNVFSVWLIAEEGLLKERLLKDNGFYQNAKNPEKVLENYLYRSEWYNQKVWEECREGSYNHIIVKNETTREEIVETILAMIKGGF